MSASGVENPAKQAIYGFFSLLPPGEVYSSAVAGGVESRVLGLVGLKGGACKRRCGRVIWEVFRPGSIGQLAVGPPPIGLIALPRVNPEDSGLQTSGSVRVKKLRQN
jgi:hypothetical protein